MAVVNALCLRSAANSHAIKKGSGQKDGAMEYRGLWGLLVLVADIWAIVNIFQSGAETGKKVLWTVLVILLPIVGFILWFFLGPRTAQA
jgi:hypothetical protein